MTSVMKDIWVFATVREGGLEPETSGLIAEARDLLSGSSGAGTVTVVALGSGLTPALGAFGANRVIYAEDDVFGRYQGELFAEALFHLVQKYSPSFILMAQGPETADLSSRLAARMETVLITRAVDFRINSEGRGVAVRPVANGYLFEELIMEDTHCPIITFLPSVLHDPEAGAPGETQILLESPDIASFEVKTKAIEVVEADPGQLDLEEADIVVSGGRGVGKGEAFDRMHELAKAVGGSVGGTRPVIDAQILPFERQIGQTGKTVTPRLIFACGISGANEFTAGMERSRTVVAVNTDPNARIFRFADLGVIGDVQEIVPRLIEELKKIKKEE